VISSAAREAGRQIAAAALARVAEPGTNRVRVEDYLTALGAVTGEAALVASGVIDIEASDLTPGAGIIGSQINEILTGNDTANLASVPADSVVGILVAELVPDTVALEEFGSLKDLYVGVVANIGSMSWGTVHLSVGVDHAPTVPPIRLAFELRPAVEAACSAAAVKDAQRHQPCALALARGLEQVRDSIDIKVALTLALEVVFGMAKMAPMSRRAFAAAAASSGPDQR
jgi:hypothetical protein